MTNIPTPVLLSNAQKLIEIGQGATRATCLMIEHFGISAKDADTIVDMAHLLLLEADEAPSQHERKTG